MEKVGDEFRPSWIDRFNNWVAQLPLRPWVFDVLLGLTLIVVQVLFLWLDSGSVINELLPVIVFNGLAVPYLLDMIRLLDNQAEHALAALRPVLDLSQAEFDAYRYRIANMPFLAPLLAGLGMTLFTILLPLIASEPQRYAALDQLSAFTVVYQIIDKISAFLFGVVLYHTIRQLLLVNEINSNHIRANVFQLRPVQAFSRLTAATALALLFFFYAWFLINPELMSDPAIVAVSFLFTGLAVLVFVWPLWSAHRFMVTEKEWALQEIEQLSAELFAEFNEQVAKKDYAAADRLNGTIMSLESQQRQVNAVPTWPWQSETARIVLTAVALPVLLMIVQLLVQQALEG